MKFQVRLRHQKRLGTAALLKLRYTPVETHWALALRSFVDTNFSVTSEDAGAVGSWSASALGEERRKRQKGSIGSLSAVARAESASTSSAVSSSVKVRVCVLANGCLRDLVSAIPLSGDL